MEDGHSGLVHLVERQGRRDATQTPDGRQRREQGPCAWTDRKYSEF